MPTMPDKYSPKSIKAKNEARKTMLITLMESILECDPAKLKDVITECKQKNTQEHLATATLLERAMRLMSMSYSISEPELSKAWWPDGEQDEKS